MVLVPHEGGRERVGRVVEVDDSSADEHLDVKFQRPKSDSGSSVEFIHPTKKSQDAVRLHDRVKDEDSHSEGDEKAHRDVDPKGPEYFFGIECTHTTLSLAGNEAIVAQTEGKRNGSRSSSSASLRKTSKRRLPSESPPSVASLDASTGAYSSQAEAPQAPSPVKRSVRRPRRAEPPNNDAEVEPCYLLKLPQPRRLAPAPQPGEVYETAYDLAKAFKKHARSLQPLCEIWSGFKSKSPQPDIFRGFCKTAGCDYRIQGRRIGSHPDQVKVVTASLMHSPGCMRSCVVQFQKPTRSKPSVRRTTASTACQRKVIYISSSSSASAESRKDSSGSEDADDRGDSASMLSSQSKSHKPRGSSCSSVKRCPRGSSRVQSTSRSMSRQRSGFQTRTNSSPTLKSSFGSSSTSSATSSGDVYQSSLRLRNFGRGKTSSRRPRKNKNHKSSVRVAAAPLQPLQDYMLPPTPSTSATPSLVRGSSVDSEYDIEPVEPPPVEGFCGSDWYSHCAIPSAALRALEPLGYTVMRELANKGLRYDELDALTEYAVGPLERDEVMHHRLDIVENFIEMRRIQEAIAEEATMPDHMWTDSTEEGEEGSDGAR